MSGKRDVMLEAQRGTRAGVVEGMARVRQREDCDLARRALFLAEHGLSVWEIAMELAVSEPTVRNLIGLGRRLAAGQGEPLSWR